MNMKKNQIEYLNMLPSLKNFPDETILFYDKKTIQLKSTAAWVSKFKYKIALNAGEALKNLSFYSATLDQIQKFDIGGSDLTFISLGGGTVGDFVGFLASTYQRGKNLVSIPSTWLAVIDSAHGGKNGLNLNGVKNQVGTFYPANKIFICKSILSSLPSEVFNDAYSEALKICIINQPNIFFSLQKNEKSLYQNLPKLINGKLSIVNRDPFEKKGIRKILNLGHTMGHVFESVHGISHGQAVFFGILFSLRFSLKKKIMTWDEFQFISEKLFSIDSKMTYQQVIQIPMKTVRSLLLKDKKLVNKVNVDFVFVKALGKVLIKSVAVDELIKELIRQQQEI